MNSIVINHYAYYTELLITLYLHLCMYVYTRVWCMHIL